MAMAVTTSSPVVLKEQPSGSYEKLVSDRPQAAECISKIEAAFAHRLSGGVLKLGQCNLLADVFLTCPDECVVDICEKVIGQYDNFPSMSEIFRLKREWKDAKAKPTGQPTSIDKLAEKTAAPWWFSLTAKLQKRGFKMVDIGDELVSEAKRRNETLPAGLYLGGGRVS